MAGSLAPISSTPNFSRVPFLATATAVLRAVCPPRVGRSGVGAFLFDDAGQRLRGDRFDVGAVGEVGVGHDGGRVGVEQDDLVAFLLQGLAGLGSGVIELAGLADDDRAGADDEDFLGCRFVWAWV